MALRDINLVPEPFLLKRLLLRHAVIWGVVYSIAAAILVASYVHYMSSAMPKRTAAISEEQARRQLARIITEINIKNEEIERLAFVRHVSIAFGTSEIMGRLAEIMDAKTWLTKISLHDNKDETYRIVIAGLSYSNARLGSTIRSLTADPYFEDVVLRDTVEVKSNREISGTSERIVQFTVEARVVAK